MRIIKRIITFILSFIATLTILAIILIQVFSSTVLSKSYIMEQFDKTDYYNKVSELVEQNFENYIQQSGLEEDVIKDIVTKDEVREDTNTIIGNIYYGLGEDISTAEIEKKLQANIDKSLKGRSLSTEEKAAIEDFVEHIGKEYEDTILHTSYEKQIGNVLKRVIEYKDMGQKVLVVILGASLILMLCINRRRVYKAFSAIGVSLLSSGVIFVVINMYVNLKVKLNTITLLNDVISTNIRNVLQDVFGRIMSYGIGLSVVGILLIIVSNLIHNMKKYGLNDEEE